MVIAHQPDDYPKPYHKIQLHFIVKGENLDPDAVERAIQLSEDKYCVVGQTLKTNVDIKTSFKIEEVSLA
jgi:putative redox protein